MHPPRIKLKVSLFAYTLATLSYGWMMMYAFNAWKVDVEVQLIVVFISAVLWTLFAHLLIYSIQRGALRKFRDQIFPSKTSEPSPSMER
jgi:uncharacterized membrane protein